VPLNPDKDAGKFAKVGKTIRFRVRGKRKGGEITQVRGKKGSLSSQKGQTLEKKVERRDRAKRMRQALETLIKKPACYTENGPAEEKRRRKTKSGQKEERDRRSPQRRCLDQQRRKARKESSLSFKSQSQ